MPILFANAQSVQAQAPIAQTEDDTTAAVQQPSQPATQRLGAQSHEVTQLAHANVDPASTPNVDLAEPVAVVQQTIDALEAQGLLMLFDRHDQVAKRLTGDLIAAGVLPAIDRSHPTSADR